MALAHFSPLGQSSRAACESFRSHRKDLPWQIRADAGKAITPASHRRWKTAGFNLGDLALSHGLTSSY
jgi:hypothetical protein